MVSTRIRYIVYTHTGGGVRHHNFGVQNNIINEALGQASAGDTINALGIASLPFNGQNLPFAFMSVHGGSDGNKLYTSPGNQSVLVGANNIEILVVYAPPGGIGGSGGGPGIWVDAFNVDTGAFSDSLTFIQVLTPPTPPDTLDNAKTLHGNAEGDISTVTAETVRASQTIDAGAPFVEWKRITAPETLVAVRELSLVPNESGEIWFAFYQTVPPSIGFKHIVDKMEQMRGKWIDDDYCGTPFPHGIGPHGPVFQISINERTTKSLSPAAREKLGALSKEYPAAARAAFDALTKVTGLLKDIGTVVAGKTK